MNESKITKRASKIAVIGGSRFKSLSNLSITHSTTVMTPYGEPSAPLCYGMLGDQEVVYLPRRGSENPMLPHKINFRANLWALRDAEVETVIATAAVATVCDEFKIGDIVIPDQLIDYTYGRKNTFLGEDVNASHIDFSHPYSEDLRSSIIKSAKAQGLNITTEATYGIAQGPRLETIAEVRRYKNDGCQIVGMTGMPEAALARELNLKYACIAFVVRKASQPLKELDNQIEEKEQVIEKLVEAIILQT